jgi:CRP/FNR family transcriptional regulator, cyclic AMP receptor protein
MGKTVVRGYNRGLAESEEAMIQHNPETNLFKQQMRDSLQRETKNSGAINIPKNNNVYTVGEQIEMVYFIESGEVKLLMHSSEGKECMLAIHASGDVFGELCLSGLAGRLETATAMEDTVLKQIPCAKFLERLGKDSLLEGFVRYLTVRIADQQEVIANLVTVDSEQRLGQTLLQLARKLGKKDPRSIRIELRISHEELASMVGTTRPRISVFMQRFRNLGLIETSIEHHLIIKETKLTAYLASIA